MQLNEVYFAGYAGKDVEIRQTKNGKDMAVVSVCHTRKPKEGPEENTWVTIIAMGWAVDAARNIKKGDNVSAYCSIRTNQYKDKDGHDRTGFSLNARSIGIVQKAPRQEESPKVSSGGDEFENMSW